MPGVQQAVHAVRSSGEAREDAQRRQEGELGVVFGLGGEQPGGERHREPVAGAPAGREAGRAGVTRGRGARRAAPCLLAPVISLAVRAAAPDTCTCT